MRDSTGRPRRLAVLVVVMAVLALVGQPAGRAQGAPGQGAPGQQPAHAGFLEPFDGRPDQPTPWHAPNWDVTIHSRDRETWDQLEPMAAQHGGNCSAPPDAHVINSYDDVVFQCNNHMMTAMNASGYGLIYLTPNQQVDFSGGEAVIRFDLSTLRSSTRDWVDIWITPFEDQVQLPLDSWLPDLTGEPQRSVHVRMKDSGGKTSFSANVFRGNQMEELEGSWWLGYEDFLTPSAVRRDPFEIRISRTSLKVGMPDYNQWWVNSKMADLRWDRAIVQFGHHSYTPAKDCNGCGPNTWHWDNISIEPAVPFTIIPGDRRLASEERGATVEFDRPAPAGSHLRFAGIGGDIAVSYDGGATWQAAQPRPIREGKDPNGAFISYWTPMPEGASSVMLCGGSWYGGNWAATGFSIWSLEPPDEAAPAGQPADGPSD